MCKLNVQNYENFVHFIVITCVLHKFLLTIEHWSFDFLILSPASHIDFGMFFEMYNELG